MTEEKKTETNIEVKKPFIPPKKRGKGLINSDFSILDFYKHYRTTVTKDEAISSINFRKFILELNQEIANKLLEGHEIMLPCRLGRLSIVKRRLSFKDHSKLRINWKASAQCGRKVYHLNEHRNSHIYRFRWRKGGITNQTAYCFTAIRPLKRTLAKILLTQPEIDYPELESTTY